MEVYHNPSVIVIEKLAKFDNVVVSELPEVYKQIIWEKDLARFEGHISSFLDGYVSDYGSITKNAELVLINISQTKNSLPRSRRRSNRNLIRLRKAIGKSTKLYLFTLSLIRERYGTKGNIYYCCLRSDLIMYFHDEQESEITSQDPTHQLAWYLDSIYKKIVVKSNNNESSLSDVVKHTASLVGEFNSIAKMSKDSRFIKAPKVQSKSYEAEQEFLSTTHNEISRLSFKKAMKRAIYKIMKEDTKKLFHAPVAKVWPELAPQYLTIIMQPMDLSTILTKLNRNLYVDVDQIKDDLYLIADNAILFNGQGSYIAKSASKIMKVRSDIHLNSALNALNREAETKSVTNTHSRNTNRDVAGLSKSIENNILTSHALADACMILNATFARNALAIFFFTKLKEDLIMTQELPRSDAVLANIVWLLRCGSRAQRVINKDDTMHQLKALATGTKKNALPEFCSLLLKCLEIRHPESFVLGNSHSLQLKMSDRNKLKNQILKLPVIIFVKVILERISLRDIYMLRFLMFHIKNSITLRSKLLNYPGFLHSLTTACYKSSKDVGSLSGQISVQQAIFSLIGSKRTSNRERKHQVLKNKLKPIEPTYYHAFVKQFFLFSIFELQFLQLYEVANDVEYTLKKIIFQISESKYPEFSWRTSMIHADFGRFMTLPATVPALKPENVLKFIKAGIWSLIGIKNILPSLISEGNKDLYIQEAINQLDKFEVINLSEDLLFELTNRFFSPKFERARRYYEKLFHQFPVLRTNCGLSSTNPFLSGYSHQLRSNKYSRNSPMPSPIFSPLQGASPFPVTPNTQFGTPKSGGSPSLYLVDDNSDDESDIES